MVWMTTFGMLSMLVLIPLYWRLPPAWRPWLLTLGGAILLGHDGWSSVAAWSALLAWLAFTCGPQWRRPALMQTLGLAGVMLAFIAYQYAKTSHGLAAYLGYAFVSLKAWHLIAEHGGGGIARDGRAGTTLGYLLFPPTLAIGPVQRYDAFRMELLRARWDRQLASQALQRMLYGYCKVVLLAEYILNFKFNTLNLPTGNAWLDAYLPLVGYGLNLYWQFSGYCDIAIGFAALPGLGPVPRRRPGHRPPVGQAHAMGGAVAPLRPVAILQLVFDPAICHTELRADVDAGSANGLVLPDGAVRTAVTWELRCTNFSCATCPHRSCTASSRFGMGDCCCCCG
jgi:hypothetical protein